MHERFTFLHISRFLTLSLIVLIGLGLRPAMAQLPAVTVTVLSGPLTGTAGQTLTFQANVTSVLGGTPQGMVSFQSNLINEFARAPLNASGQVSVQTADLGVGLHLITAVYEGGPGFLGSASLTLSVAITAATPPANDNFADRIAIAQPGTVTGTNVGATAEANEPAVLGRNDRRSVWWSFTPAANGALSIDTFGSGFDTVLAVFTGGSLDALAMIAENDNAAGSEQSRVAFQASAGTVYQIFVADSDSATGDITLNVALEPDQQTATSLAGPAFGPFGQPLTFTATVTAPEGIPTGMVRFRRDGSGFGIAPLNAQGVATLTTSNLPVGTHQITARFQGSDGFEPSVSTTLTLRVAIPAPEQQVGTGQFHSCGRGVDQLVVCWGGNANGQLGDGTTNDSQVPVSVAGLNRVVQLAVGDNHSCALRDTGRVFCWGANDRGQLGDGTTADRSSPVRVEALTGVVHVSAGKVHSCAVRVNGEVFCWGANGAGQLGDGTTGASQSPVRVSGLTGALQVAAGGEHSCALRSNGRVFCWGDNASGQLGTGGTPGWLTPVRVRNLTGVIQIATGGRHSCALRDTGRVFCWGAGGAGQLGNNASTGSINPVRVVSLSRAMQVSAGDRHSCALRETGVPYCWGANGSGQLGDGTTLSRAGPVMATSMNRFTEVAAGVRHSCAARDTGRYFCWGNNGSGQLGNNSTVDSLTPVRVR